MGEAYPGTARVSRNIAKSTTSPFPCEVFERHNVDGLGRRIHGTLENCGGAKTPWGTVLTCEEGFQEMVVEAVDREGKGTIGEGTIASFNVLGSKYGWVVEVDPFDPASVPVKHTALGRFRHENVGLWVREGQPVVGYMGEDRRGGHIWKFVSRDGYRGGGANRARNLRLLSEGRLFVAFFDFGGKGRWIPMDLETEVNPVKGSRLPQVPPGAKKLGEVYASLGAVLTDAFLAANLAGGTPTANPEYVVVHPKDGSVYIAFTAGLGNEAMLFRAGLGQIWWLVEGGAPPAATEFRWERFSVSGRRPGEGGYANPDNLLFDSGGTLWMCTDMWTMSLNNPQDPAGVYGNSGVFVLPTAGPDAGKAFQYASGPCEAELTGPSFTPDEQTLFLSVQHPGEGYGIRDGDKVKAPRGSNWPSRALGAPPRPAVVAISRR